MKKHDLSISKKSFIELEINGISKILKSSVEINDSIKKVWDSFCKYEEWGEWNSFIPIVKGDVREGNIVEIKVVTPGLKEMNFKPKIFSINEMEKISWGGGFLFLYNGIHDFIFERIDDRITRFIQIEKFEGPMVLFMDKMIRKTALGYIKMNEEFKDYIEKNA